ncbi:hypothetical protein [Bradyrhizobium sp.]|uniref:hypothetical protein n=1 Tax=Bradyrhizobium sp. TaxID=376 RepID=UPI0039E72584
MKWINERDALIAQTLAFVQSVTGKKDEAPSPPTAAPSVSVEVVTVEAVRVEAVQVEAKTIGAETVDAKTVDAETAGAKTLEVTTVEVKAVEIEPAPVASPPRPAYVPSPRAGTDFRTEMQGRIANFRKHQERFEREREEYYAETLTKLRAALRDSPPRPPAGTSTSGA